MSGHGADLESARARSGATLRYYAAPRHCAGSFMFFPESSSHEDLKSGNGHELPCGAA